MEDPGLSRLKKGSSAWKMVKIGADVAVAPFSEDLGRSRLKKEVQRLEKGQGLS